MGSFVYREQDLLLSLRYYLLTEPVRRGDGTVDALPNLYPTMKNDLLQNGVRIGDLYLEEKIPSYPCMGLIFASFSAGQRGFGFKNYRYPVFLDVMCRVDDAKGHVDRPKSEVQRGSMLRDLRLLLTEQRSRSIPLFTFPDSGADPVDTGSTFAVSTLPECRIEVSPVSSSDSLGLHAAFMVELYLRNAA